MRRKIFHLFFLFLFLSAWTGGMYCDGNNGKVGTGPDSVISADAQAAWSPDGTTIAVCWSGIPDSRNDGVYLIDTETWTTKPLFVVEGSFSPFSSPSWCADGEWLAFAANAQIYKIRTNGDSLTQLTNSGRQWFCDWSRSDTLIAYNVTVGDSGGIWLMDIDGNRKRLVIQYGSHPAFSVGDSILFLAQIPGKRDSAYFGLFNVSDSTIRRVYAWGIGSPFLFYYHPHVSPDGHSIVLSIDGNVWTMTIEGDSLKQLTFEGGRYPHWSPDGSKIVYCKPNSEGGTLWIMNKDGTDKTRIEGW